MTPLARRLGGFAGWRRLGLAVLAGALLAAGQPPVSWPVVLFVALPVLLWQLDGTGGPAAAFGLGWAAGVGFFAAGMFWIVDPFLVEADTFGWLAPFALVGMAGGLALFWGATFAIARLAWRPGPSRILLLAAVWTLVEVARSHLLTGFPWALPAYAWVETPVMQAVSLIGPHGLSFLTLVAGLAPGLLDRLGLGLALALVAAGWGFGAWRLAQPAPVRDQPLMVRLVQPNAVQQDKWLPGKEAEFLQRHLALTRAAALRRPDVTIWSETAVSFILDRDPFAQAEIAEAVGPRGRLILGIRRVEVNGDSQRWFNSLAVLAPDGTVLARYDKHRLVPFGEYIPLKGVAARLGIPTLTTLTRGGFTPGPGPAVLTPPGMPPFLPLICYEAIFPQDLHRSDDRPGWLVQVTNDAWFGKASGPYQHFAQARIRAIEQGLPLARAANTGISAMIDSRGQVVASLGLGRAGSVDALLPGALPPTIYARTGDAPTLVAIALIFGLTFMNIFGGISTRRRR